MLTQLIRYLGRHHVGLLALVVALSGTAYAASLPRNSVGARQLKKDAVTSSELKNNAVTSRKVKNLSLRARDFARGQLPAGPQGPRGAQGPPGPTSVFIDAGGPGSDQALCPAGEVAVGGGGISDDGFLTQSQPLPFDTDVPPVGWKVGAKKADGTPAFISAWVVCAS
jgi:hypothetical protein